MVQFYRKTHEYPDPPPTPLLAFFLRYPNPFARHVLSADIVSRTVDPESGQILTSRLILKRGIVPRWATQWMPKGGSGGGGLDAWVLEESVVDPPGWDGEGSQPRLRSRQGNLSFKKFMHVIEGGELRAGPNGSAVESGRGLVRSGAKAHRVVGDGQIRGQRRDGSPGDVAHHDPAADPSTTSGNCRARVLPSTSTLFRPFMGAYSGCHEGALAQ
ncbi:secretory carrier-associated membrane protein, partial [Tremellales sp. Uapishka_1]